MELEEGRMFYTDDPGGDPPVLFVHGFACDSLDWIWQFPAFAGRHRIIAPDLRAHGRSSAGGTYTAQAWADDLASLLTELKTGPVIAVGHSLGGAVVSALAVEHPDLVKAVVAVDPGYGIDGDQGTIVETYKTQLRTAEAPAVIAATFARIEGPNTPPALVAMHSRRALGTPAELIADVFHGRFESAEQFALRPQSDAYLARRACPVLSFWIDPDRAAWEAVAFHHPLSRVLVWEAAGHWLHQERPETFNAAVLAWIEELR